MIRVLIVDDDFMVARIHTAFVEQTDGFEVVGTAHNGAEALDLVASLRPTCCCSTCTCPTSPASRSSSGSAPRGAASRW